MMNEFRRHPKVCGWLYTEHHDVINEWNGYYRFDRSDKFTGLSDIVPGMTPGLRHLGKQFQGVSNLMAWGGFSPVKVSPTGMNECGRGAFCSFEELLRQS